CTICIAYRILFSDESLSYIYSLSLHDALPILSEAGHQKGYYVVNLDGNGETTIEKKPFSPVRDLRQVKGFLKDILELKRSEDYVFVTLLDETPILSPMEKIRSVFPNALHVERGLDSIFSEHQESAGMNQP